jgi:twitching motility protein PilT
MTPVSIDGLVQEMKDLEASDLHLTVGSRPVVRRRGDLEALEHHEILTGEVTRDLLYRILSTDQQKTLETRRHIDMSYEIPGVGRLRVNVFFQKAMLGAAFRMIPTDIKSLRELGLPQHIELLADKPRGLVLVTGPTGSGKSTTLASLIDHINSSRSDHILTIEDPIEFLHHHRTCIVNQREIGFDTPSFAEALRAALRQDPDVILVGEMRDLETIATALTAAETGHLVFATLHTQSAPQTIDRVIDVFPAAQQDQVRIQLAGTLQGIVTQNLVPTADHLGRVAALEILLPDDAVRNLIRQGKIEQIYSVMQTGTSRGMQTMEQSLADLLLRGVIDRDAAMSRTTRPEQLDALIARGVTLSQPFPAAGAGLSLAGV